MLMTDENLKEFLKNNQDAVNEHIKRTILENITKQLEWHYPQVLKDVVTEFMTTEIAPMLKEELTARKPEIYDGIVKIAVASGQQVALAIEKQITENLSKSWNVDKLVEALLK